MSGAFFAKVSKLPIKQDEKRNPPTETLSLRSFLKAYCLIVDGQVINRYELISYVANKLGGAHYDNKRTGAEQGRIFCLLDKTERIKFIDKDVVYFELLSIGQVLTACKDIESLLDKARQFLLTNNRSTCPR